MAARTRAFSTDDQLAFARLSGDYNPIHLDPLAARRFLFGQPVVHGMHALLWAVDRWLEGNSAPIRLTRLKVRFRNSIALNVAVELAVESKDAASVRFEVTANGVSLLTANVAYEPETSVGMPIAPRFRPRFRHRKTVANRTRSNWSRRPDSCRFAWSPRSLLNSFPTLRGCCLPNSSRCCWR